MVPLPGSNAPHFEGARISPAPPSRAPLDVTLRLRRMPGARQRLFSTLTSIVKRRRAPFTRAGFARSFGAAAKDVRAVVRWAKQHELRIVAVHPARRTLTLRGPDDRMTQAFGVRRVIESLGRASWRTHAGPVYVPRSLAHIVTGVIGFDGRPVAGRSALPPGKPRKAHPRRKGFTAVEVADLYGFPPGDGQGQTVGVIALGGGYQRSDLRRYYKALDLPLPRFIDVSVEGVRNRPTGPSRDSDGEVTADIETVGALAPAARIVVYFAPNSARGFLNAVATAVHDERHAPSVLSISWGRAEVHWARRTLRLFDEILLEAALLGVTVCCSSGDHGAFADVLDRVPHVCFPGASPYALACGGTSIKRGRERHFHETAWSDKFGASGGGVSVLFPRPAWQMGEPVPLNRSGRRGRGVPDVAANGDPATGYRVFVWGKWCVGAGTSAAAPLWAGLIARLNQARGAPLGLVTPFLYRNFRALVKSRALRPIAGRRGKVRRHWNRHTGLGAPTGAELLRFLRT
jgi:kumamolisin